MSFHLKSKILAVALIIVIAVSVIPAAGIVFAKSESNTVTIKEATAAALAHIQKHSKEIPNWNDATIGAPVYYYAPEMTLSAYEFTVTNAGKNVGYIFVSARKDWMPVLEYGDGLAPSVYLDGARQSIIDKKYITSADNSIPKLYYWGACTYSMQLGEKMKSEGVVIDLPTDVIENLPKISPKLQMDTNEAKSTWAGISDSLNNKSISSKIASWFGVSKVTASALIKPVTNTKASTTSFYVGGVPPFYQGSWWGGHGDDHDPDSDTWPACSGYPDDLWADWDGCSPIAGAMVLGYWSNQGYTNIPNPSNGETEDILIDDCHAAMFTDYAGATTSNYIDYGMRILANYRYGYNFASLYDNASWNLAVSEILSSRPFVLSFKDNPTYGGHSVCAYGYTDDGGNSIRVFNTWDTSLNTYITWGNWTVAFMSDIHP